MECTLCGRASHSTNGCDVSGLEIDGVMYDRIAFGKEPAGLGCPPNLFGRCPECGAKEGYFHHSECDIEICPACGDMRRECGCNITGKRIRPRKRRHRMPAG